MHRLSSASVRFASLFFVLGAVAVVSFATPRGNASGQTGATLWLPVMLRSTQTVSGRIANAWTLPGRPDLLLVGVEPFVRYTGALDNQIWLSDDAGVHWRQPTSQPWIGTTARHVSPALLDSATGPILIAGLNRGDQDSVLLASSDLGATWVSRALPTDPACTRVDLVALKTTPAAPRVLYAELECPNSGTPNTGPYRSLIRTADAGQTWTTTAPWSDPATLYILSTHRADRVFAVRHGGPVRLTDDNGAHWGDVGIAPGGHVSSAAATPARLIAVEAGGAFISNDSGDRWTALRNLPCVLAWTPSFVETTGPAPIDMIGCQDGRFVTTGDDGSTYSEVSAGPWPTDQGATLTPDWSAPGRALALTSTTDGAASGLWRTDLAQPTHWTPLLLAWRQESIDQPAERAPITPPESPDGPTQTVPGFNQLVTLASSRIAPDVKAAVGATPGTVGALHYQLLISRDAGDTWVAPPNQPWADIPDFALTYALHDALNVRILQVNGQTVLTALPIWYAESALLVSSDFGQTWAARPLPMAPGCTSVEPRRAQTSPAAPARLLVAAVCSGPTLAAEALLATTDAGLSWTPIQPWTPVATAQYDTLGGAASDALLLYRSDGFRWSESPDGGVTWSGQSIPGDRLIVSPEQADVRLTLNLGISAYAGYFSSPDGGRTWRGWRNTPCGVFPNGWPAPIVLRGPTNTIVAYCAGLGLTRSSDLGQTWQMVPIPDLGYVTLLAADDATPGLLYVQSVNSPSDGQTRVYVSADQGDHWRPMLVFPAP